MPPLELGFGAALLALVAAIAAFDIAWRIIPDALNLGLAVVGLGFQASVAGAFPVVPLAWAGVVLGLFWGFRAGFHRWRGVVGLGLGDVKLAGAAAIWIEPWNLPLLVLAACLLALGFVGLAAAAGRPPDRRTRIPFGPFLGAGLVLTWALERSGLPTLAPSF